MGLEVGAGPLQYEEWRRSVGPVKRSSQFWTTREKVYRALADRTNLREPERAWLYEEAGISEEAFRKHFGAKSPTRFVDDAPIVVAIVEAKEWSWAPYRHGLSEVLETVTMPPHVLLDALIRALAEWAIDTPALASYRDCRPPESAVQMAADAIASLGGDVELAEELMRSVLRRSAQEELDESSLGVLNAVRPDVDAAVGDRGSVASDEPTAMVEVLSSYAQSLLSGQAAAPRGDDQILQLLDRLKALIEDSHD